jgi:hypothetical protein
MSKKKMTLLPVDLSIFAQDWKFVAGVGNYNHKQACIMSALYLATKIAEGKTTLEKVLAPIPKNDDYYTDPLPEQDRVTCVSDLLRDALVERNDSFENEDARTKWAIPLLPRVLGTKLGNKFEQKVKQKLFDLRAQRPTLEDASPEDYEKELAARRDADIEFMISMFDAEKAKRKAAQEKRAATMAAKKVTNEAHKAN